MSEHEYAGNDGSAKVFVGREAEPQYERSVSPEVELAFEVAKEMARARSLFPAINSLHEGLAIVEEEFIEFRDEVFAYNLAKGRDTRPKARAELIQLAAMALRTIFDVIDLPKA